MMCCTFAVHMQGGAVYGLFGFGDYIMAPEAAFNADWADDGRDASAIFTDWLSCTYY